MYNLDNNIFPDLNKENAIVQLTNSGDRYYHSHDFYEIFYITSGSVRHSLNNLSETLSIGDVRFLRPGDIHCFLREPGDVCTHRDIAITVPLYEKIANFFCFTPATVGLGNPLKTKLDLKLVNELETSLQKMNDRKPNESPAFYFAVAEIFKAFYAEENTHAENKNAPEWIINLISRLERPEDFCRDVNEIFSDYNYSKEYICRTFKKTTGITLTEYLNQKKLSLASILIQNTNESIESICYKCGYNNVSYFYRAFKTTFNKTPHEFRKINPTD